MWIRHGLGWKRKIRVATSPAWDKSEDKEEDARSREHKIIKRKKSSQIRLLGLDKYNPHNTSRLLKSVFMGFVRLY